MEVLRLENLSKYYTSENSVVMGLTGINLSFSTGEFVALTGESGSGKSTLAHVLGGILPYESGELFIYGEPTSHYDSLDWERYRRDLISFISQSYGILPGNTFSENVESALRLGGLSPEEAEIKADEILREVELFEFKARVAGKLSSGQKQRLSIARALAKPSKILIADEPTGNLDRENSENVIRLLKKASRDRLVILITHEFEEAKDAATRRIILSDGAVATDAKIPANIKAEKESKTQKCAPANTQDGKKKPLAPYISYLTVKSRPVFTAILSVLLTVTTFISFVFLGTFTVALDDSSTRAYDTSVFYNGTPERIVIMKNGAADFTEEDYKSIIETRYAVGIERWGYTNDIVYHYKPNIDHRVYEDLVFGPDYHPVFNPSDYTVTELVEFYETDYSYFRTLPYTEKGIIKEGRAPEDFYEVVSSDSSYKVGDVVSVYLRNKQDFGLSAYISFDFTVVGETSHGDGLYFSDKLAAALERTVTTSGNRDTGYGSRPQKNQPIVYVPYEESKFKLNELTGLFAIEENGAVIPEDRTYAPMDAGDYFNAYTNDGEKLLLRVQATYRAPYTNLFAVSEENFEKLTDFTLPNQISLYIKDYSYTERVIDSLTDKGYIAISPYKMGTNRIIADAAVERLVTLAVSLGAVLLSFILQSILLRAMFNSLNEYFKLLSNIGLTAKTAMLSLSLSLLAITLFSEILGGGIILLLNGIGIESVASIFKYLDAGKILLLFAAHLLSVGIALLGILRALKKNVFGTGKRSYDIDFTELGGDAV